MKKREPDVASSSLISNSSTNSYEDIESLHYLTIPLELRYMIHDQLLRPNCGYVSVEEMVMARCDADTVRRKTYGQILPGHDTLTSYTIDPGL